MTNTEALITVIWFFVGLIIIGGGLFVMGVPFNIISGGFMCLFGGFLVFVAIVSSVEANK